MRTELAASRRSAAQAGLTDRVTFELEHYRATAGTFDRIVSVGMFEHVGPKDYGLFFDASTRLLADDGVMQLHTMGQTGEPAYTYRWIRKYIFPGGHMPTLTEIMPAMRGPGWPRRSRGSRPPQPDALPPLSCAHPTPTS